MSHDEDVESPAVVDGQGAFALLRAGVPLSLLCDLAVPVDSRELFDAEPADTTWIPTPVRRGDSPA